MEIMRISEMSRILDRIRSVDRWGFSSDVLRNHSLKNLPQYLQDLGNSVLNKIDDIQMPCSSSVLLKNGLRISFYNGQLYFSTKDEKGNWQSYKHHNSTYYYKDKEEKEYSLFYPHVVELHQLLKDWIDSYNEFSKQVGIFDTEYKKSKEEKNHALFAKFIEA